MNLEEIYTSTDTKLLKHLDRLSLIQNSKKFRPITLQLSPTDKCNLNCPFCSVKKRPISEMKLEDIFSAIDTFKELGILGVEITGGGDPTMYYGINELIQYLHDKNLKIGLITNGVLLNKKIHYKNLKKLLWLRVSLNSLDFVEDIQLKVPKNVTLGFSYVWYKNSTQQMLDKVQNYAKQYNASFVRVVPDCLSWRSIEKFKKISKKLKVTYKNLFFQTKDYIKPKVCWFGYLKPFLYSDGYIYHCSANPLIERMFHPKFRMGHWKDIKKIWKNPKPFDTKICGLCFFRRQNEIIDSLFKYVPHKEFI